MKLVPIETLIEKSREYVLKKDAEPFPWFVIEAEDFDKAIKIAKKWKKVELVEKLVKQKQEIADKPVGENNRSYAVCPSSWVGGSVKELQFRKAYKNQCLIREEFEKAFPFYSYFRYERNSYFDKFYEQILSSYEEYKNNRNYFQRAENRLGTLEGLILNGQSLETEEDLDLVNNKIIHHKDWNGYVPPNELPVIQQTEEANV